MTPFISFQHREQFQQHFLALLWIRGVLGAVLRMLVNDHFCERLEGLSYRRDLSQHVRTVAGGRTVGQAVLLGIFAAFSHSLIIWALAALDLKFGGQRNAETTEPYFQLVSAVIIVALALWMFWRTRRDTKAAAAHERHCHDDTKLINTGHGIVNLFVFETGVPPVFRLAFSEPWQAVSARAVQRHHRNCETQWRMPDLCLRGERGLSRIDHRHPGTA